MKERQPNSLEIRSTNIIMKEKIMKKLTDFVSQVSYEIIKL